MTLLLAARHSLLKLASVSLGTLCLPQAAYAPDPIYTLGRG